MKRICIFSSVAIILVSCGNNSSETAKTTGMDTTTVTYAYTIEQPDNWLWGTKENTQAAMMALKGYEDGNIEESMKHFADSVKVEFDGYEATLSKDSLAAMFKRQRDDLKSFKVDMNDFESVISKDGKDEYVSLWYKQISEGKDGKIDSMQVMDDAKMKNGKIVLLNEKMRHYPAK